MNYLIKTILLITLTGFHCALAEPIVVNEKKLLKDFEDKMVTLLDKEGSTTVEDLKLSLKDLPKQLDASFEITLAEKSPENLEESVFIIAPVFDCGKCDRMHMGGVATAWPLTSDGIMVSNYHVFAGASGEIIGVSDIKGKVWPVTKLIAANKDADICIFQVKGDGFKPMALGETATIGEDAHVIGHPGKRFFSHTFGKVSRYYKGQRSSSYASADWMSITADFAKGSSGGPVLNDNGAVVGMVSFTTTISYDSKKEKSQKIPQMVVKSCTPIAAIKELLGGAIK